VRARHSGGGLSVFGLFEDNGLGEIVTHPAIVLDGWLPFGGAANGEECFFFERREEGGADIQVGDVAGFIDCTGYDDDGLIAVDDLVIWRPVEVVFKPFCPGFWTAFKDSFLVPYCRVQGLAFFVEILVLD